MAWLSGIIGKAVSVLYSRDQKAASVLTYEVQEAELGSKVNPSESPALGRSASHVPTSSSPAPFLSAQSKQATSSQSATTKTLDNKSSEVAGSSTPVKSKAGDQLVKKKDADEALFEFLNSSEPTERKESTPENSTRHSRQSSTSSVISNKGGRASNGGQASSSTSGSSMIHLKMPGTDSRESPAYLAPDVEALEDAVFDYSPSNSVHSNNEFESHSYQTSTSSSIDLENILLKNEVAFLDHEMASLVPRAKDSQTATDNRESSTDLAPDVEALEDAIFDHSPSNCVHSNHELESRSNQMNISSSYDLLKNLIAPLHHAIASLVRNVTELLTVRTQISLDNMFSLTWIQTSEVAGSSTPVTSKAGDQLVKKKDTDEALFEFLNSSEPTDRKKSTPGKSTRHSRPSSAPTERKKSTPRPSSAPTERKKNTPGPSSAPTERKKGTPGPSSAPTERKKSTPRPSSAPTERKKSTPGPSSATTERKKSTTRSSSAPTERKKSTPGPSSAPTERKKSTPGPSSAPTERKKSTPGPSSAPTERKKSTPGPLSAPTERKKSTPGPSSAPTERKKSTPGPSSAPTERKKSTPRPSSSPTERKKSTPGKSTRHSRPSSAPTERKKSTQWPSSAPTERKKNTPGPSSAPTERKKSTPGPSSLPTERKKSTPGPSSAPTERKKSTPRPSSAPTERKKSTPRPSSAPTERKKSTPGKKYKTFKAIKCIICDLKQRWKSIKWRTGIILNQLIICGPCGNSRY